MTTELAIIIPAYKPEYLYDTLESIRNQTDQRFSLYIFDDQSPANIKEIVEQFTFDVSLTFKRFDENLGRHSLTKQWERCISETTRERWIWLFSDDDIMEENCVASFYETLKNSPGYSAYRFDTKKISETGDLIRENQFPKEMDGARFLNEKLSYKQESYIVEYIFSRDAYDKIDGFPDFPLGWAADDLFCLKLAEDGGIYTIQSGSVHWRYSDSNISGENNRSNARLKLKASSEFVDWIMKRPNLVHKLNSPNLPLTWFVRQIRSMLNQLILLDEMKAVWSVSQYNREVWRYYFEMKKNRSKLFGWLKKFSS